MAAATNLFQSTFSQVFSGAINLPSDSIKMALLAPTASPSLSSWVHYSDVVGEVANGNGYTTGGVALTGKTLTATPAASWGTQWAASTPYAAGSIVVPATSTGLLYSAVVAGSSGPTAPTWPTVVGESVADGTVVWSAVGESVTAFSSASASWMNATLSTGFGVIYDAQSGSAATEPLICLLTFAQTLSPVSGNLTIQAPSPGWFFLSPA